MKLIVTGALGHIGSYLVRDFAAQFPAVEIVMIDNLSTQRYPSLFNLPSTAHYDFVEADVTTFDLRPLLARADAVIHLAAITDAAGSFERAEQVEANNFEATHNVAEACLDVGTRLVLLSSTSVYGTQNAAVSEDCAPDELRPQSPYARTKLKEEALVASLCGRGLRAVAFRFGTIFGVSPGMRFHTAVNKFCWQAAMGQPVTVWSTAYEQKRPYLALHDGSRAIAFAIQRDLFDGRVYNVLTRNATVRQIVETIREFVPDLEVRFVDDRIMNQLSYEVSCERLLARGFTVEGDLRQGIGDTINLLGQARTRAAAAGK
jgi:UDP-glucose 4-epimerase